DSYQNTWRTALDYQPGGRLIVFYAENIKGGANHQITISATNGTYYIGTAVEYAGLATSNSLDTFATNRNTGTAYASPSITTTQASELLFGLHHTWTTNTVFTPGAGWNQIQTIAAMDQQTTQDQIVSSMGSFTSTGTEAPAPADTLSALVAFKGAAAAPVKDTTAPTVPTVTATAASISAINVAWTASTDNVGVT